MCKKGVVAISKNKFRGKPFTLTIDERYLAEIRYKLGSMEKRAPNVLANALNQTLTQLKKYVPKRISEMYTYKQKLQAPNRNRASYKKLKASLVYKAIPWGEIEKISFKSFDHKVGAYGTPRNSPGTKFQAKIDSDGSFKERERVFETGDTLLARVENNRYPLKHALGPSETTMVRGVNADQQSQDYIRRVLDKKLDNQINNQYLKKWGAK